EGIAFDPHRQALVLREETLKGLLDGFPSLEMAAPLVRVIAIRRPEGGHGRGVSLVERLDECLGIFGNRFLVRSVALGLLAHSWPSDKARHQSEHNQKRYSLRSHGTILSEETGILVTSQNIAGRFEQPLLALETHLARVGRSTPRVRQLDSFSLGMIHRNPAP